MLHHGRKELILSVLKGLYTIHRFGARDKIPTQVFSSDFFSISNSADELSIVCNASIRLNSDKSESGWSCIKLSGPLAFDLTGILADITTALAKVDISLFAVSTFETDYILIKSENLIAARAALQSSGYAFAD